MAPDDLRWSLLQELDAWRRRDPERVKFVGQIPIDGTLERLRVDHDAYLEVATRLRDEGLIAEPSIDQLSVRNGGVYITTAGLEALDQKRKSRWETWAQLREGLNPTWVLAIREMGRHLQETGRWPEARAVERAILHRSQPGTDVARVLRSIPIWLGSMPVGSPNSDAPARLLGLTIADGLDAAVAIESFWRAFTLCRALFLRAGADGDAQVCSADMGADSGVGLGMPEIDIRRSHLLLSGEGLLSGGQMTLEPAAYDWRYTIADHVFRFRDVTCLDEYLDTRAVSEGATVTEATGLQKTPVVASTTADKTMPNPRDVFLIHGRDTEARQAVEGLLRDLDLRPLDWDELVRRVGKGSPYTGEVVNQAFREAQAVIGLMTPDDEVHLHADLRGTHELAEERVVGMQARPNVLIELGMALAVHEERTIIVEIGEMRPITDLEGRNIVKLGGTFDQINRLKTRLETAQCAVRDTNPAWANVERFKNLSALRRSPTKGGARIAPELPRPSQPRLEARVERHGASGHRLIVRNVGEVRVRDVSWDIEPEAGWDVTNGRPSTYPIPVMDPGHEAPTLIAITQTTKLTARVQLHGTTDDGQPYEGEQWVSV